MTIKPSVGWTQRSRLAASLQSSSGLNLSSGRRYGWRVVSRGFVTGTVVLLVLFCGSLAFNIYQHLEQASERQARLEETLSRPSRTPGSLRGDPEVKELSYPRQMRHPNGMTTAEADTLLKTQKAGTQRDLIFLDVRERRARNGHPAGRDLPALS
jgi:hypothetical protein